MYSDICRRGLSSHFLPTPDFTLLYPGIVGCIALLGIAGIVVQQLAGDIRALAAVEKAFLLAAGGHRAFPMEGMAVCLNTASAVAGFPVVAFGTVQSAS